MDVLSMRRRFIYLDKCVHVSIETLLSPLVFAYIYSMYADDVHYSKG